MNEAASPQPSAPVATPQVLREWLGVLVLSTGILRHHGAALTDEDRLAQRKIMHEAGVHLEAALAHVD